MPHYTDVPYVHYLMRYNLLTAPEKHHLIHPTHQSPLKSPYICLLSPFSRLKQK